MRRRVEPPAASLLPPTAYGNEGVYEDRPDKEYTREE